MIHCIGDGENAYGRTDSSEKNLLLMDRESVFSNLEFHKGLIWTIREFDNDFNQRTFPIFEREYNLHSITGLSNAARGGKKLLKRYWNMYKTIGVRPNFIAISYYILLMLFNVDMTNRLLNFPRRCLEVIRYE